MEYSSGTIFDRLTQAACAIAFHHMAIRDGKASMVDEEGREAAQIYLRNLLLEMENGKARKDWLKAMDSRVDEWNARIRNPRIKRGLQQIPRIRDAIKQVLAADQANLVESQKAQDLCNKLISSVAHLRDKLQREIDEIYAAARPLQDLFK